MPEVLEQEDCAGQMQISRPMFQHILMNARQKIADSLIHGKGIRIEGGTFTPQCLPVQCLPCGRSGLKQRSSAQENPTISVRTAVRTGLSARRILSKLANERLNQEVNEVRDHASNDHIDG